MAIIQSNPLTSKMKKLVFKKKTDTAYPRLRSWLGAKMYLEPKSHDSWDRAPSAYCSQSPCPFLLKKILTLVIRVNLDVSTIFVSRWNFLHPYPLPFLLSYLVGSLGEFKRRFKKFLLYLKRSQVSEIASLSKIFCFVGATV